VRCRRQPWVVKRLSAQRRHFARLQNGSGGQFNKSTTCVIDRLQELTAGREGRFDNHLSLSWGGTLIFCGALIRTMPPQSIGYEFDFNKLLSSDCTHFPVPGFELHVDICQQDTSKIEPDYPPGA